MKKRPFALIPVLTAAVLAATVLYSVRCANSANTATADSNIAAPGMLELYFFGSNTCGECLEIKHSLLFPLEQEMADKLKIHFHATEDTTSFKLMVSLEKQYGVTSPASQELFFPDTVLLGYTSIMANGRAMVEEYLNDPQRRMAITVSESTGSLVDAIRERLKNKDMTLPILIVNALVDSVNPCAIATLVFLVSFLATQKRKRSEILIVGLAYSTSVFVTYFLLGLGVFGLFTALGKSRLIVSCVIKWSAVALAGTVGVISLIDAFRFKKSGDTKDITLQLPKSVKLRIHKIITTNMKGSRLIIGTIITGFLVTLLEAACTGQVYIPTIAMVSSNNFAMILKGVLYLLLYCFIFIVPLLAVMIAVYYGMTWNKLSKMMQNNLTLLKILLGTSMIGLALYLALLGKRCW